MEFKVIAAFILLVVYGICLNLAKRTVRRLGKHKQVKAYRVDYIGKTLSLALTGMLIAMLGLVLGIEYSQLSVFFSSVFAVVGVALFAQWSILSNITASLIIFFGFPYRVGDTIRVVDKDDDIAGTIEEISMFHVIIRRGDALITYPNNLIVQKAVIKGGREDVLPPSPKVSNLPPNS